MRSERALREDMWSELIDRDLDLLLDGKQPHNTDLAPLRSFVNMLGSFGATELSPGFPEDHAADGAAMARARLSDTPMRLSTGRRLAFGLRRRVTAAATSLMMIVGMTGVAWAADSAVPGDWNYGLDRALESVGIGAGGTEERLQELIVVRENGHVRGVSIASGSGADSVASSDDPVVGLEKAAATAVATTRGSQRAIDIGGAVSKLLAYLADTEKAHGPTISELAKEFKQAQGSSESNRPEVNPGEDNRPDHAGKPASPGNR